MRATLAALALALAACAPVAETTGRAPATVDTSASELAVSLPLTGQPARDLLERLAAQCWLDGVVRGGTLLVDRRTGRVLITSDTEDLLVAQPVPADQGSRVRLTGPAAEDPATLRRLVRTLDRAVTTGRTDCPVATG